MQRLKITKKKIFLLSTIVLLLLIFGLILLLPEARTPSPIPLRYIGNWINDKSNHWEYGFFEDFVIYECDFWDYHTVIIENEEQIALTLTKGVEKVELQLSYIDKNKLQIKSGDKEAENFSFSSNVHPDYSAIQTDSFSSPTFRQDSVTIIGYYRNLDKGLKRFSSRFFPSPFRVAKNDFLSGDQVEFYADMDRLGRFKITFPVMNTEELFVDWKRTRLRAVLEPGDTIFLFVDINDYMPTGKDKTNYESYVDRSKQILFMGDNARLNNEIYKYKTPWLSVNKSDVKDLTDMEFLRVYEDVYNKRMAVLNDFIEKHPLVSEKFIFYNREREKLEFAFHLMQHKFDLYDKTDRTLQDGYIKFVEETFSLDNELTYTLTRDFNSFLRDYIDYIKYEKRQSATLFDEIEKRLQEEGKLTDDIKKDITEIHELTLSLDTIQDKEKAAKEFESHVKKLNAFELINQTAVAISSEKSFLDTSLADSLIANQNLRELWTTNRYRYWFEVLHKPLSVQQQAIFKQKVTNPYLRDYIDNVQNFYGDVANESISYEASLKNTEHLKEYQDAETLFEELIKPYRGKVIYVDFWGTWCAPCRENMKYMPAIKDELKGEDVIFMYFANRSPKATWENIIKEMNLTGENIVHYRLPDEQQGMIERKHSVSAFPTYMLINKEGKVVVKNALSPRDKKALIKQIQKWI